MIAEISSSSPAASSAALSGPLPPPGDGKPPRHGRREDAMDRTRDAAPTVRGDFSQSPPPPGAEWNVPPDAPYHKSIQVWIDRSADLAIANLRTLGRLIEENKDALNLLEVMQLLERIDEQRRTIRLAGISDAPLTSKGRLIDERA